MRLLNRLRRSTDSTTTPPPSDSSTCSLPPETVYEILRNERRRRIIQYLATMDAPESSARELADHLASLGEDSEAAYIALTQNHLNMMSTNRVIIYNSNTKSVKPTPDLDAVHRIHKQTAEALN